MPRKDRDMARTLREGQGVPAAAPTHAAPDPVGPFPGEAGSGAAHYAPGGAPDSKPGPTPKPKRTPRQPKARSAAMAIAGKEFTENVHSRRFQIALGLATLLLVTSVITLSVTYQEDLAAFEVEQADRRGGDTFGSFNRVAAEVADLLKRPNPLSVFTGGAGDDARREAEVGGTFGVVWSSVGGGPVGDPEAAGGSGSPTNRRFDPLDLGFVAIVVMTFMAVLFAYDAVVGEREKGTLKLMMTNPVPRDQILLGKYLGGMASLLVAFGVAVLVALAAFQFTGMRLDAGEWLRLGLILLLVVPLASAFFLMGLLVSSLARRSGTSLLALLLVWLVLAFGVGNVSAAAAKGLADVTTDADIMRGFDAIEEERRSQAEPVEREYFQLLSMPTDNGTRDPASQARINVLQEELQGIAEAAQEQRDALVAQAKRELESQLALAEGLAAVSPSESYRSLATSLAGSDYWTFKRQKEAADLYLREVERERAAWNEEHRSIGGTYSIVLRDVSVGGPVTAIPAGPDFEPPEFRHDEPSAWETLASGRALLNLAVLLAYNVVAFAGAYVAFLRYDVR